MGTLLLLRHGQASRIDRGDYDHLSDLGRTQAAALGQWLGRSLPAPSLVVSGPARRHRDTAQIAAEAAGPGWAATEVIDALDEHDGQGVFRAALPTLAQGPDADPAWVQAVAAGRPNQRMLLRAFRQVMTRWAEGAYGGLVTEDWSSFCRRVAGCVDGLVARTPHPGTVVAHTSGGVMGAAVGHILGLGPVGCLNLTWTLYNTTMTELRVTRDRVLLVRFNATPHLEAPDTFTTI
jgi:broad specificity phosphatase PhoE